MKVNLYKIFVLTKKDMLMLLTNKNQLLLVILPIAFAIIYQQIYGNMAELNKQSPMFVLMLCGVMNVIIMPLSGLSMMVAEEKEKNTMRTLLLSNVSAFEFLVSKIIASLFFMEIAAILIFFITKSPMGTLLPYLFLTLMTSVPILLFGAVIGIIAKDQMATGTYSAPIMMVFLIPPFMAEINEIVKLIAQWVPTFGFAEILRGMAIGTSLFDSSNFFSLFVMLAWIVLGVVVFFYVFKKKGVDN